MIDTNRVLAWVVWGSAVLGGGILGSTGTSIYYRAQLADQARTLAEKALTDQKALAKLWIDAQGLANTLSVRLAETQAATAAATLEKTREIPRVTTGRPCLGPAAVRLLNGTGAAPVAVVPAPAGPPAAEGGAAASDSDVAGWIAGAQGQYETCRARLGALIDFEEGLPQ